MEENATTVEEGALEASESEETEGLGDGVMHQGPAKLD
jgi:hypothetical protein